MHEAVDSTPDPSRPGFKPTTFHFRASFRITEDDQAGAKQSRSIPDHKGIFSHYFEADHPFIFIVWDYFSGMILLMGKVVQPAAAVVD